jgi:hypothetical protein
VADKRIAFVVYVNIDPMPGVFHTEQSALDRLDDILKNAIPHYSPSVAHAPDSMQPQPYPPNAMTVMNALHKSEGTN